ncbi:hscarg dehydrogenase [Penicillium subrubescens]|uniref:NmrA-like family domain-containing protein n=1 Tax=Penicillium subrubescens TaxID=1316194 RepID=A0A1Q5UBN8_9EURO|nr:hscarg dehydrogenase [Penicillium subrubescens]KAJ5904766.1 hscarg dehydrogenase [Penicillium subrubescens]OKP09894.1 NmrA-like family domain-containing protein [Penicillium subrubescens]
MAIEQKVVTVFGATGLQGNSVVRALLRDQVSNFRVRAITRDPGSEKSQTLQKLGVEVIKGDGWSKDDMCKAFSGSWGAFVNTNSDDPIFSNPNVPTEFDLGKTIVDGMVAAGVKSLVISSMRPAGEATAGKMKIKTMDMKAAIAEYAQKTDHFETISFIHAGWYFELFLSEIMAKVHQGFPYFPDADGYLNLVMPKWGNDSGAPFIAIEDDFGDLVHGIMLDPMRWNGKIIQAVSDIQSLPRFVQIFSEYTGKKARYVPLPSWKNLGEGIPEMEDGRLLFAFGEATNGRYFGEDSCTDIPMELKKLAFAAQGKATSGAKLASLGPWFSKNFGTQ